VVLLDEEGEGALVARPQPRDQTVVGVVRDAACLRSRGDR
jgi:hypothetical protein